MEAEPTPRIEDLLRPSGPPPRMTRWRQVFDVLFAILLIPFALNYLAQDPAGDYDAPVGILVLSTLVACAALSQRRRFPLAVLVCVAIVTIPVVVDVPRITYYGCLIAAYSAAAYSPFRAPTYGVIGLLALLCWQATGLGMPTVPEQYVGMGFLVLVVLAGIALRLWRSRAEDSETRLARAEREQAETLRQAVETERARIARELHDVVTHNVSVMVIQAGAARRTMDRDPAQAQQALLAVEGAGRTAMAELRHVMGLLAPVDASLAPQPGLDQVQALVDRVRDTGMAVDLSITGTVRPVPAGEALAAYRVVQEALTNAVKHASGASAHVTVHYGSDELRVEVQDTGGTAASTSGSGRGLLGLRERLAVYGGTLRTGPLLTGDGYRVKATIPLGTP